jgi:hypothetical protein
MKNIHLLPTDKPSRLAYVGANGLCLGENFPNTSYCKPQNIYITSDEEIKEGDWFISNLNEVLKCTKKEDKFVWYGRLTVEGVSTIPQPFSIHINLKPKKIILTTDQDLIKDGVQAIDDEFLEWFIDNPSFEFVEVETDIIGAKGGIEFRPFFGYKIIIPKEEPKDVVLGYKTSLDAQMLDKVGLEELPQETTLEEIAKKVYPDNIVQLSPTFFHNTADIRRHDFIQGYNLHKGELYSEQEVFSLLMKFSSRDRNSASGTPHSIAKWFEQFKK